MNVKCDYCGSMVDERSQNCPKCGAPLSGVNRTASSEPKTIEELQAWYTSHNLPPEEITRFFIGKNIQEPKAFGIYKNEIGDCVVYKNKANGERAIRYQGADEAYAVNELYQRLRAEIVDQKANNPKTKESSDDKKKKQRRLGGCGCFTIVFILAALFSIIKTDSVPDGYYKYNNTEYYNQGDKWYQYDADNNTWLEAAEAATLADAINSDNADQYKYSDHEGMKFEESNWYDNGSSSDDDDDWDSDDRWDSDDDWSSSSTDWDSDW